MERKFYPENFENFLKGHADQFKLTPSKKVWHGIYNDIHPGRRWPSIAMSMVFLFTLVIIGHLNTNNGNAYRAYDPGTFDNASEKPASKSGRENQTSKVDRGRENDTNNTPGENMVDNGGQPLSLLMTQPANSVMPASPENLEVGKYNSTVKNKTDNTAADGTASTDNNIVIPEGSVSEENINTGNGITAKEDRPEEGKENRKEPSANADNIRKPARHSNVSWTYYISPSISYRSFSDEKINDAVTHMPAFGYEGGIAMDFPIYKKLKFTAGFQVNYSDYRILANNTHPTVASLGLNADLPGQTSVYTTMSQLGNSVNNEFTRLKNYSLQASIPLGLQYSFPWNDKFSFGVTATFQPSLIIASKGYLLSDDKRNYLTDRELLRKWNMNTGIAPYLLFSSNSLKWQIGPQFRYQLLSTYTNRYPVKEHLINYGIRIGISQISK